MENNLVFIITICNAEVFDGYTLFSPTGGGPGGGGGGDFGIAPGLAGGSGVVIVKELNKASGVWSMQSQFSAKQDGTWPEPQITTTINYLVVAGGGGGGSDPGGPGGDP